MAAPPSRWVPPGQGTRRTRERNRQKRAKRKLIVQQDASVKGASPGGPDAGTGTDHPCPHAQPGGKSSEPSKVRRRTFWDEELQEHVVLLPVHELEVPKKKPGSRRIPQPSQKVRAERPSTRRPSRPSEKHLGSPPDGSGRESRQNDGVDLDPEAKARLAFGLPLSFA